MFTDFPARRSYLTLDAAPDRGERPEDRISFAIAELSPAGIDKATKDAKENGTLA